MKKLLTILLLSVLAFGQRATNREQDSATIYTSGTSIKFQDTVGSQTNQFEMVVAGSPATVSVTIVGCMRSGTCSGTLTSTTNTTNSLLSISGGPYDYYQVTGSWTGGSSPTLTFNRTGSSARSAGGGAGGSLATSIAAPTAAQTSPANTNATLGPSTNSNNPFAWVQNGDATYDTWAGIDTFCDNATGPPCRAGGANSEGTPVFYKRTYFNDTKSSPQAGKNAFLSLNHTAGTGTFTGNQDRTIWLSLATPANDTTTHYGLEALQTELDYKCSTCNINGSPDGEVSVISGQMSDTSSGNTPAISGFGMNVARLEYFKNGAGFYAGAGSNYHIINGIFSVLVAGFNAGTQATIYEAACSNGVGGTLSNFQCNGVRFTPIPTANRPLNGQVVAYAVPNSFTPSSGATCASGCDWFDRNDIPGYDSLHGGKIYSAGLGTSVATIPVAGSLNATGAYTTTQLATPANTSASCNSGTGTTWTYKVVAKDSNGATTLGTSNINRDCNATLDGSHFVTLNGLNTPGASSYDVYRTVAPGTPSTTGKIGTITPVFSVGTANAPQTFVDNGLAGDGSAVPAVNTTGGAGLTGDISFTSGKGQHVNTQAANNDFVGTCTLASATPSTCTVTFTRAYTAAPVCVATNQTTQANPIKSAPTASNVVFTGPNTVTDVVAYMCVGNPN